MFPGRRSLKLLCLPSVVVTAKIRVPAYAGPVELQAPDIKLGGGVFERMRRPDVFGRCEKPLGRLNLGFDDDTGERWSAHGSCGPGDGRSARPGSSGVAASGDDPGDDRSTAATADRGG